jgi:hypothetical protein
MFDLTKVQIMSDKIEEHIRRTAKKHGIEISAE